MPQNLVSLTLSDGDFEAIDTALTTLEKLFASFITLTSDDRHTMAKMGDKSEAFCRQAIMIAAQNKQFLPPNLDVLEAQSDLSNLDRLRPRLHRLQDLLNKASDTDMALGSDIYMFSLDAYGMLKIAGKGSAALDALRESMSVRFSRGSKAKKDTPPA